MQSGRPPESRVCAAKQGSWGGALRLHSRQSRFKKRSVNTANPSEACNGCLHVGIVTVSSLLIMLSTHAGSPTVKVEPREIDELLANPGMGWTLHFYSR